MFTEVKGISRVFNYRLSAARIQQPGVIADVFADLSDMVGAMPPKTKNNRKLWLVEKSDQAAATEGGLME